MSVDVSLLVSLLLGLPVAVLAVLQIIDRRKKKASMLKIVSGKQHKIGSPDKSADQELAPIINQAEMAAEVEKLIADELRQYEANHWG